MKLKGTAFLGTALVACALLSAGCASDRSRSSVTILRTPYEKGVEARTRTAKLYRQFDTLLIVDAILEDDRLVETGVDERAAAARLDADGRAALLAETREKRDGGPVIYVALYTADKRWNDLHSSDTRWVAGLVKGDGLVRPKRIDKVRIEHLPMRAALPFPPDFRTFYRLTFDPAAAGEGPYRLSLAGPLGGVELSWDDLP